MRTVCLVVVVVVAVVSVSIIIDVLIVVAHGDQFQLWSIDFPLRLLPLSFCGEWGCGVLGVVCKVIFESSPAKQQC